MKLLAFKVENFRSIVDSGWCSFSQDRVTVLVGQNESGKTSLLDALDCMLGSSVVTEDDRRSAAPLPSMRLKISLDDQDIANVTTNVNPSQAKAIRHCLASAMGAVELETTWKHSAKQTGRFSCVFNIPSPDIAEALTVAALISTSSANSGDGAPAAGVEAEASPPFDELTVKTFATRVEQLLPGSILFNSESGLLPSRVDIDELNQPIGTNSEAAKNFLRIADINLEELLASDLRAREYVLGKANEAVSKDFNKFWTQTIGPREKLSIHCQIENYGSANPEKLGKPHLVFFVGDGLQKLFPKQRSQGVRWFISFYLQLRASEKDGGKSLFLMDEPGANLHPKAQEDVLRLINQLSQEVSIVYSTHSPALLEYSKLYRVHAVQRNGDEEDSPTVVIDAHRLAAASTDTLTPLLHAMGTRLHGQDVIRKQCNVLVEELSGFYYFHAFWKLAACSQEAHFIAATGASNIPALASMFLGWGLQFIVVVDDDTRGRSVFNELKRDHFGGNDQLAARSLWKISGCTGIEDVFSTSDFQRFVLRDPAAEVTAKNTDYLRKAARAKPVMAYQFWDDVQQGRIALNDLEAGTVSKIREVVKETADRLAHHST